MSNPYDVPDIAFGIGPLLGVDVETLSGQLPEQVVRVLGNPEAADLYREEPFSGWWLGGLG
jgi:hypothetical protein